MTEAEWQQFLRRWNDDLFRSPVAAELPHELKASRWLGRPPATEPQISQTEERLAIALPLVCFADIPTFAKVIAVAAIASAFSFSWHRARHVHDFDDVHF